MSKYPDRIWAYAGAFKMWRDKFPEHAKSTSPTEYIRKDVSDALVAALEPMDKPRVKPLAWKLDDNRTAYAQRQYFADRYCIEHRLHGDDVFDLWIGPDAVKATRHPTLETAKAAAQADYEARILAALE